MNNEALGYFCLGTAVGVAAAVLLTPKSGPETRTYLTSRANDGVNYLKDRAEEISIATTDGLDRGKKAIKKQADGMTAAVDAGKQAYREALIVKP